MGTAGRLVVILLTPSAVAAALLWTPHIVRAVARRLAPRPSAPVPVGPPLEKTAADLRRLMAEHVAVRESSGLAVRAGRLVALEGALTDLALLAAEALEVPSPPRSGRAPLPRPALHALLQDLAAAGLVLPSLDRFGREAPG